MLRQDRQGAKDLRPDLRSLAVGKHVIFYRPSPNGIEVVRVLQGKRDIEATFESGNDKA